MFIRLLVFSLVLQLSQWLVGTESFSFAACTKATLSASNGTISDTASFGF
jgi:hypothetical protein